MITAGKNVMNEDVSALKKAIWYYVMVWFRTIDLILHAIAQFEENHIIRKKNAKFK